MSTRKIIIRRKGSPPAERTSDIATMDQREYQLRVSRGRRPVKKVKITAIVLSLVVCIYLVGYKLMEYNLAHTDFSPLSDLFKARLGEVLTVPVSNEPHLGDAKLFDTYQRAFGVVRAASKSQIQGPLPKTSSELSTLPPEERLDGWGRPFCLAEVNGRVAAISSGPKPDENTTCDNLNLDFKLIESRPAGKLYQYPSGALVLLAEPGAAQPSQPRNGML
jgi:hypothetical protein